MDIGDGYTIVAANSFDVGVVGPDGSFVLNPRGYTNVGPVIKYAVTPESIFTMNFGAKKRNDFPNDTFVEADESRRLFFVISKGSNEVFGPMDEAEFLGAVKAASLDSLRWRTPEQTYREQAISGGKGRNGIPATAVAFLLGLAVWLCWQLCAAVVAASVLVTWHVMEVRRRHRLAPEALDGPHAEG